MKSARILVGLLSLIATLNAADICDNDECLLSLLGLDFKSMHLSQHELILTSYDMANTQFTGNALIWTQPSMYFTPHFMQTMANSPTATDDDFRASVYRKYISSRELSLTLKITHFDSNNNNQQQLDQLKLTLLSNYKFDGVNLRDNENGNVYTLHNTESNRIRRLQGNYGQGDELEFDILNQRTYDEYDWFLYAFALACFGCCCLCCGWCGHKKYVANLIVDDKDIESLQTPITPSGGSRQYSFRGFNLFGEALKRSNSIKRRGSKGSNSMLPRQNSYSSQLPQGVPGGESKFVNVQYPGHMDAQLSIHGIGMFPQSSFSPTHLATQPNMVKSISTELDLNNNDNSKHTKQLEMLSKHHQYAVVRGTPTASSAPTAQRLSSPHSTQYSASSIAPSPVQSRHLSTFSALDEQGNVVQMVARNEDVAHSRVSSSTLYQPAPPMTKMSSHPSYNSDPPSPMQAPVPAPTGPVKMMSNPDQQQRKTMPKIVVPPKNAAIVPRYKEQMMSPQTVGLATPDSAEDSQSHLSMEIEFGGMTPSESAKTKKQTAAQIIGYMPDMIAEDAEVDTMENPYAQPANNEPAMSPPPLPPDVNHVPQQEERSKRSEDGFPDTPEDEKVDEEFAAYTEAPEHEAMQQLHVEIRPPEPTSPIPEIYKKQSLPEIIDDEDEDGLEAIDECSPSREIWTPETAKPTVKAIRTYDIPVSALQEDIQKTQTTETQ